MAVWSLYGYTKYLSLVVRSLSMNTVIRLKGKSVQKMGCNRELMRQPVCLVVNPDHSL